VRGLRIACFISVLYEDVFWAMLELGKPLISALFRVFWSFPENAWRRMNCCLAAHEVVPSFLGLQMIRLAACSDPPGVVIVAAVFLFFVGLSVT